MCTKLSSPLISLLDHGSTVVLEDVTVDNEGRGGDLVHRLSDILLP